MSVTSLPLVSSGAIGKFSLAIPNENRVDESQGSAFPACQPAGTLALGLELQNPPPTWSSGSHETQIKLETGDASSIIFINRIIELARNRATLISQIRELLVRGETQEVIPLVRILCGLEN
jgi:hypothetical protein